MAFGKILTKLYRGLPVIRELRKTYDEVRRMRRAVLAMREEVRRLSVKEVSEFLQFSLLDNPRYGDPKRLLRYAAQTFSQGGEDGAIAEICRRIGASERNFVEVGVGNGLENNTVFLLSQGWKGWWLEADEQAVASINATFRRQIALGNLSVLRATVTAENVANLFRRLAVPAEFDLLSIDIDRNTYWVWAALSAYKPRIVVVEYNASYPPDVDWKVEYRADAHWNGTSYFGASLKAYELLGRDLGYSLVGCEVAGTNAFFVRNDLCADRFAAPFTAENHYEPPRYGLVARYGHPPGFTDVP
jgi:hypothetical protein